MKRLISCTASEIRNMNAAELKNSIKASEGRVVMAENVVLAGPMLGTVTNAELAVSFGADMILLNGFDCFHPVVMGLPESDDPIRLLQKLTGSPIGVNLEPVDLDAEMLEDVQAICKGRQANVDTFKEAEKLGFDYICLTGNPGTGVTNKEINKAVKLAKEHFNGLIIAGKMHGAGVNEAVVDLDAIKGFIESGADIILMPAVGTVPGLQEDEIIQAVKLCKESDVLTLTAIGTSQETSEPETIREFALSSKRCGIDIQHIGDAGWGGVAFPENIMAMSIAIRGKRHTYFRIAQSVVR